MPKDFLDLIDTTIKIGLGAAIAGITTSVIATKKFKYERLKNDIEDQKNLIKKLSLKYENANSVFNKIVINIRNDNDINKDECSLELATILRQCQECIDVSICHANILGLDDLRSTIEDYAKINNDFLHLIYNVGDKDKFRTDTQNIIDRINKNNKEARAEMSKAYKQLNVYRYDSKYCCTFVGKIRSYIKRLKG